MRLARGSYKRAVDIRLAAGGFEDLPATSGYLLDYLASDEETIPERIEGLGIKRREFRQLVATLVRRGYITREIDPADGSLSLALTERGNAANEASFEGCNYVDQELERRPSETDMAGLRRGLAALGEIKQSLMAPCSAAACRVRWLIAPSTKTSRLMHEARDVYRDAVRRALETAGCDDIPRNAVFVLAGLDHRTPQAAFSSQADVVASLGLSKQAASQLIDTLVLREYLERRNDPVDRRRMEVRLTARGRIAAIAIRSATDRIDATVAQLVTADELHGLRAGLAAYRVIHERSGD
jgi:DNA-binding MarR family transcriptional regulator